jgi:hypothetical protein
MDITLYHVALDTSRWNTLLNQNRPLITALAVCISSEKDRKQLNKQFCSWISMAFGSFNTQSFFRT